MATHFSGRKDSLGRNRALSSHYIEIRLIDGQNAHDVLFKGKARIDDTDGIKKLLNAAKLCDAFDEMNNKQETNHFLFRQ